MSITSISRGDLYLKDRLSEAGEIPSLASLIRERAEQLDLGASWEAA